MVENPGCVGGANEVLNRFLPAKVPDRDPEKRS